MPPEFSNNSNLEIVLQQIAEAIRAGNLSNTALASWTSFTPTWTNLTVGNGTVTALYIQIGKVVHFRIGLVFGTTTSISGAVSFTLPVPTAIYTGTVGLQTFGVGRLIDTGTASFDGPVIYASTTTAGIRAYTAGGTYLGTALLSATVPHTWANTDQFYYSGTYEAA